jgi:uncharacterized protein (TIGR01244 family)
MKKLKSISVLLVMLLATLPLLVSCQDKPGTADQALDRTVPAQVEESEVPGVTNFSRIGNTAGFGGATQPTAMAGLKDEGFASVINVRLATEPDVDVEASAAAAETAGLKYIHLPFDAADPDPQLVDDFLAAVGDEANQPVYIHCNSATRVAALWMIKRVIVDGWEFEEARGEAEVIAEKPADALAFVSAYLASDGK